MNNLKIMNMSIKEQEYNLDRQLNRLKKKICHLKDENEKLKKQVDQLKEESIFSFPAGTKVLINNLPRARKK